jgi:succinoglycan biosynthesis protein ExoM
MTTMKISLCIATFRRPERLAALLDDLVLQELPPDEVVVVDNDAAASARWVVERRLAYGAPFPIRYALQPVQNIALTRNLSVSLAQHEWLAFIDDDERAPPDWLGRLAASVDRYQADGALGPVEPVLPEQAPPWIRQGHFYDWVHMDTGTRVPPNQLRFGNVLMRGELLHGARPPFDAAYGLTGGEDGDLLARLVQAGARIVWCNEAIVNEPVETARLSLRWLLLRALRGGQDFARHSLAGRYGPLSLGGRWQLFSRALAQAGLAAALSLVNLPRGTHRAAYWLLKAAANLGKMSVLVGWHYHEYQVAAT